MEDTPYDGQVRALVENLDVAVILRQVDPPRYLYVSAASGPTPRRQTSRWW
jgi:hypothetical protein